MIGFELKVKGERFQAALKKGVVSVIITKHDDFIEIDFGGLNKDNEKFSEYLNWHTTSLKEGDEITVSVKNILQNSEAKNTKRKDKKTKDEYDLENYRKLKERLEKKVLI